MVSYAMWFDRYNKSKMLSFIFVIMSGIIKRKWISAVFFICFIFILQLENQLSREVSDPINRYNPAISFLVLVPACGICAFNDLRREVIVLFVDIGGIVDHHCLNFLFIMIMFLLQSNETFYYRHCSHRFVEKMENTMN